MKSRHKKLLVIVLGVTGLGIAAALILNAFQSNLVFFFSPTQVERGEAPTDRAFRIGGLVESGSVKREADGLTVRFVVTDTAKSMPWSTRASFPTCSRKARAWWRKARLGTDGTFNSTQVLAKHDENYMPPEAAHALEQAQKAQETLVK
jgi:cytochrome c-type biogenesis protein CcmE